MLFEWEDSHMTAMDVPGLMHVTCASVVSYEFSCDKDSKTTFLPL